MYGINADSLYTVCFAQTEKTEWLHGIRTLNLLFADKVIQEISYDKAPYSTHSGTNPSQHWGIGAVAFIGEMN